MIKIKREKMKRPETVANILSGVLGRGGIAKKIVQYSMFEEWDKIVGPTIARQTRPKRMQGNTLIVAAKNASWVQELSFMKTQILKKINEHSPDTGISDIRFIAGMS